MPSLYQKYRFKYVFWSALFLLVFLYWFLLYRQHLIFREQLQLFLITPDYLLQHLLVPGGTIRYLGEFTIQFFGFGWLASLLTTALLFSVYFAFRKVLENLNGYSPMQLLAILPSIYYTFLLKSVDYYLNGLFGLLFLFICLNIYVNNMNGRFGRIITIILIPSLYWLAGGVWLPFLISLFIIETDKIIRGGTAYSRSVKNLSLYLFIGVLMPVLSRQILTINWHEAIWSLSWYRFAILFPDNLKILFAAIPVIIGLHLLAVKKLRAHHDPVINGVITTVIVFLTGTSFINFEARDAELNYRYSNLVYKKQWQEIVTLANKNPPADNASKSALILALSQLDNLPDGYFELNMKADFKDFFVPYNRRGMASFMSSEPLFYLGLVNFSKMFAIETIESTPDGVLPVRAVKRAAECHLISGEYAASAKYLSLLQKTLFYRQWAKESATYLYKDAAVEQHPEWGRIKRSIPMRDFFYNTDQMRLALIQLQNAEYVNSAALNYLMLSFLIEKDLQRVLTFFPLLMHQNENTLPRIYNEALIYIRTLVSERPSPINNIEFDPLLIQRLNRYATLFRENQGQKSDIITREFGDSYWYYIHFK